MKLRESLLLLLLCSGLVWAGSQEQRLARLLEQYPEADADGDGRLTREEAQAYRQKLQGRAAPDRSETGQGVPREFRVDPGWDADRFGVSARPHGQHPPDAPERAQVRDVFRRSVSGRIAGVGLRQA